MSPLRPGERSAALLSALVAVGLLAVGVTAEAPPPPRESSRPPGEASARRQFELGFSHDRRQLKERIAMLDEALAAYGRAPATAENQQLLREWLATATRRSIAGNVQPLPPLPDFRDLPQPGAELPRDRGQLAGAEGADDDGAQAALPQSAPATAVGMPQRATAGGDPDAAAVAKAAPQRVATTAVAATPTLSTPPAAPAAHAELPRPAAAEGVGSRGAVAAATPTEVAINLTRLDARIRQCHAELVQLGQAAAPSDALPSQEQLADWTAQLERIADAFDFADLYYQALTPEERSYVTRPTSPRRVAAILAKRLEELASGGDGDFLRVFDARRGPELEALRLRLRVLGDRYASR
jgi:hypothetical protein